MGEQIGIKPEDIDWATKTLHIRRAITYDESGNFIEGKTKNKYSRRSIKLSSVMLNALLVQKEINNRLKAKYFFCNTTGKMVDRSGLRREVWLPALNRAGLSFRAIKQTRHTFATLALSLGESPLWIANHLGHRNTEMIIRVYGKYIENAVGCIDPQLGFSVAFCGVIIG